MQMHIKLLKLKLKWKLKTKIWKKTQAHKLTKT